MRVQLLYFYMVFIVIQLFSSFNKKAGVHAWEYLSLCEEEMGSFLFSSEIKYWFLLSVGTATSSGRLAPKQGHPVVLWFKVKEAMIFCYLLQMCP